MIRSGRCAIAGTFWVDVSKYQKRPVDSSYPHPFLAWRIADGTYIDPLAKQNRDGSRLLIGQHRMVGHAGYYVPRPYLMSVDAALRVIQSVVQTPDAYFALMQDVESWGGAIGGDHSTYFNDLHSRCCNWLASRKRVIGYANHSDFYSLWQHPVSDVRVIGAGYGHNPNLPGQIGWQYSDGDPRWPVPSGWPRSSAPFGPGDHNHSDLTPAQLAAALGLGTVAVPLSIEEEVMAFYKSRAEFEQALTNVVQNGAWGPGRNAQWWFWRLLLGVSKRHGTVALNANLLDVYTTDKTGRRVLDQAATAQNHAMWGSVFDDKDPVELLTALQTQLTEVAGKLASGARPPEVLHTRPKDGNRMFQPVNDYAERRWVSQSQAESWAWGYKIVPLTDDDPFWGLPSLTAHVETEADQVEQLGAQQSGGQP